MTMAFFILNYSDSELFIPTRETLGINSDRDLFKIYKINRKLLKQLAFLISMGKCENYYALCFLKIS